MTDMISIDSADDHVVVNIGKINLSIFKISKLTKLWNMTGIILLLI